MSLETINVILSLTAPECWVFIVFLLTDCLSVSSPAAVSNMQLIYFSTEITGKKGLRVLLLSYRVKCIRFVTFAVVTLTACSERLVACKNNLCENNIHNNTDGYDWFPSIDWKTKIKGLKPKGSELELTPKCFPLNPKFSH